MPTNSLYDATIRQQIYLEGLKNEQADKFDPTAEIIIGIIGALLYRYGVSTVGELTKRQLSKFRSDLTAAVKPILKKSSNELYALLREFISADFIVTKKIYSTVAGTGAKAGTARKLWAAFTGDIVPGTGMTSSQMIATFMSSVISDISHKINMAYAENLTIANTMLLFTGTKSNGYRDGSFRKLNNQFNTLMFTLLQKARNFVNFNVSRIFYDEYEWVSVLDSRTSEICRSRDGNRYKYGSGPVPPAHYNCRSSIVPVASANPKPGITPNTTPVAPIPQNENSFYKWLLRQPVEVQEDIIGKSWSRALRQGKLSPQQISGFDTVKKLTIDGYRLKVDKILAE